MSGANAGRAVFEAVGRFGGLIREGKRAEDQMGRTRKAAEGLGDALPADGGRAAKGVDSIISKVSDLGDKFTRTGQKATLGLTTPITLLGGSAIRSFAEFEKALTGAQIKAGASEKQYGRMKDLALEMGAATSFSAAEAAASLENLAALGFDAQGAMKALPGVLKAAQASGEDLVLTTDTVAKAMNAFNEGDANKVADLFAQAANTTALGMEDIAYGIANAGEVGPRFGQNMEGVIAVLGRMVDMGVPAASAGVAIRSALVNLAAPTNKASGFMKNLGIEVRDAQGRMKQLPDLMGEMQTALNLQNPALKEAADEAGMTGRAYRDMALKGMFGVEGAKAVALAISDGKPVMLDAQKDAKKLEALQAGLAETMGKKGAKAWIDSRTEAGKFTAKGADAVKVIDALGKKSKGVGDEAAKMFEKTTAKKIDNFTGAMETLRLTLVDKVLPAITKVIEKTTKWVNKITEFTEKHDWAAPLITGALVFLAALGPIMIVLGQMLKMVGGVGRAGRKLAGAVRGRGKNRAPGTGAGGGADLGAQSVFWTKPMPVYITKAAPASGGKPGSPGSKAPGAHKAPGRFAGGGRVAGGAAAAGLGAAAITVATGGSMGDAAKMAGLFAALELASVAATKVVTSETAKQAARWVWLKVKMLANAAKMATAWVIGVIRGAVRATAATVKAAIIMAARWAWMAAKVLWQAGRMAAAWFIALGPIGWVIAALVGLGILIWKNWDKIKKWTAAAWEWVWTKIKKVWGWISEKVGSAMGSIGDTIRNGWEKIKGWWGSAVDWLLDKIQPLLDAWDKVKGIASKIGGKAKDALGFQTGGEVPGSGRGDIVPARLEPGEYVVRRKVVQRPGVLAMLQRLNKDGASGRATSTFGGKAAMAAARYGINATVAPVGGARPPDLPRPGPGGAGGGMTVIVQNPERERASQSVSTVLKTKAEDEGWLQ